MMFQVTAKEIKQWEKEDPHDIDKVPIETRDFHGSVIFRCKCALPGFVNQPCHNSQSDDHVQSVQTGHRKVDPEEHFDMMCEHTNRQWFFNDIPGELARNRDMVLSEFVRILQALDNQE